MQLTWTRTVPDAQWPTLRDNICSGLGYRATLMDGTANPVTKAQFIDQAIMNWLRTQDRLGRSNVASASAVDPTNDIGMT